MKPLVLFLLYVARYSLPVSASYRFEIPPTVTVGVPIEATCIAQTLDDFKLSLFPAQAKPGQENDPINGYATDFKNPLKPDPSTGATRFVVASPGMVNKRIKFQPIHPIDNSVAFRAVDASTSSAPSTPSASALVAPAGSNNPNNGTAGESSSTSRNNDTPSSNSNTIIIAVVVTVVVVAVAAALIFIFWYRARHLKKEQRAMSSGGSGFGFVPGPGSGSEASHNFYGERMMRTSNNNMVVVPGLRYSGATGSGSEKVSPIMSYPYPGPSRQGPGSEAGSHKSYTDAPRTSFYGGSTIAPSDSISQVGYQGRFKKVMDDVDEDEDDDRDREMDGDPEKGYAESFMSIEPPARPTSEAQDRWGMTDSDSSRVAGHGHGYQGQDYSPSYNQRNLVPVRKPVPSITDSYTPR
ncbi:hypothetical protein D9758_014058 [Tetrapyrgos nigripes]|uniref:Uncharacterized protein n=1 Tax=Tetrapyrgos nigripes TaxID=182062 RepID=A0A8H5CHI2_9AGAR|nr:hypothetical protein D9758_014058 [Tetrapyrgos nigripes]